MNPNLQSDNPDTLVSEILLSPVLHLIIGVVDKHLEGLERVFGMSWVDKYLKKENIVRKSS